TPSAAHPPATRLTGQFVCFYSGHFNLLTTPSKRPFCQRKIEMSGFAQNENVRLSWRGGIPRLALSPGYRQPGRQLGPLVTMTANFS
ncbi:MAG: hypothetical protein LBP33_05010, partial [Candidatus Adiutrix sp.]|nr:hypothetical protein [Candidatus Adiutrix sp.]